VDASSVADEAWRTWSWLWVTSTNEDGVQGGLNIASYQLIDISIAGTFSLHMYGYLTPGRKYHPARENKPLADIVVIDWW